MKYLESLDFSVNKLNGNIPPSMLDLSYLVFLNLSHNNFSGLIPMGSPLIYFKNSSYAGNEGLCGIPLSKICPTPVPAATTMASKNVWSYLDVLCGFATGLLGVIGALLFNNQWRIKFYRFAQLTIDNIYVAVAVKLNKMKKRPGESI
ncbi:hypothetical protein M8C21_019019 [Ambrosia artemisiifolia]|uniref:Uncharacterized protein n=1 Tax=Ambrosia artemisiifolia TaxID=4212 RepID=A0AAD5G2S4_AMBAR|nr:hypothetical protein M8C21_019019 [Ambrosia artemisiifolia]